MKRGIVFTIAFVVTIVLFVFIFYFLGIPTRIRVYSQLNNTKSVLTAEVLDWDPYASILTFKYAYNGIILTSKTKLTFPEDSIRISRHFEGDCKTVVYENIDSVESEFWSEAFHIGDIVEMQSGEIALGKSKLPEEVDAFYIVNNMPLECKN